MKDRYTAGLLAGLLGGFAGILFELFLSGLLHFGQLSFLRFAGGMLFLHAPQNLVEQLVATVVHLLFSTFMGGAFAYFIYFSSDRYDLVKGAVWGLGITFVVWAVTYLFRLRPESSSAANAIENDLSAAVYGVTLALSYRLFHRGIPAGKGAEEDNP